ncbi:MAG: TolC family outer membrane protein [Francisellaceae bacterium]
MKKGILILVGALLSSNLYAAVTKEAAGKNLAAVYQLAESNNGTYKAAEATFEANKRNVPIALAALLPSVAISYDAQENYSSTATSPSKNYYFTQEPELTASQSIFDWATWKTFSQAQYQLKADGITFAQAQQSLILSTASAYFNILQAEDNLVYAEANKKWNKELLDQTEEKYKVGMSAITDVQSIKAQYEQAVASEVQAKSTLATAYATLAQITGGKIAKIDALSDKFPFDKPQPDNMDKWLQIAMKSNLNIVQNAYLLSVADAGVDVEWGNFIPSASLSATANRTLSYQNSGYTSGSNSASAGVTASLNLINGGADYASLRQAKYTQKAADFTLLEAQREAESSVKTAYLDVLSDIAQVEAYHQAVIAAEASVKAMQAGYDVGTQTIVDLLNQQQQLFEAQQQYAQAKYSYINDLLTLKADAGVLSYTDIDAINKWLVKA